MFKKKIKNHMENNIETTEQKGTLINLMTSSNKQIKAERANQVINNIHLIFKGKIDALFNRIGDLKAQDADLLQKLVPSTTLSTSFEVNASEFVDNTIKISTDLVNASMLYEALKIKYQNLFGRQYQEPEPFL